MSSSESILVCNAKTEKLIKQYVHFITLFLKETSFLTEAYILDYFTEQLWQKVPSSWLEVIKEFETPDLVTFLNCDKKIRCKKPLPLSLLALRASASLLTLPRKSIQSLKAVENFLSENFVLRDSRPNLNPLSLQTDWTCASQEFDEKSGQHKKIPEFCRRHVKPKKQHEIFRLAEVANCVLTNFGLKHIVEIGSGLGHLSRFLTLSYNFHVATIEANHCHVSGAALFDKQAVCSLKRLKKHNVTSETLEAIPYHMEESLTLAASEKSLEKVINDAWFNEEGNEPMEFALLGLHTCGNLVETILKAFVDCNEPKVLISVGCCYMKQSSNDEESYPLSRFVKSLPAHRLSYEAKEMACHALELYIKRLKDNAPSLKIHCYRATLEKCIITHFPKCKHLGLRGVKHAELLEFSEYARQALSRVSCPVPNETLLLPETQLCLGRWKEVLVFYSLRLIIAPVVETLILLDRLLFLFEQGYPSCIAAVFDPTLSPRNHILLSAKYNKVNISNC